MSALYKNRDFRMLVKRNLNERGRGSTFSVSRSFMSGKLVVKEDYDCMCLLRGSYRGEVGTNFGIQRLAVGDLCGAATHFSFIDEIVGESIEAAIETFAAAAQGVEPTVELME